MCIGAGMDGNEHGFLLKNQALEWKEVETQAFYCKAV
jgi:hypothetical protein